MRGNRIVSFILMLIVVMPSFAFAVEPAKTEMVPVSLPGFQTTLNGVAIDNTYRQYPLIVYKDITYVPMTFDDSKFMNLQTRWDAVDGLTIMKAGDSWPTPGEYVVQEKNAGPYTATIVSGPIKVNGTAVDSSKETYPPLFFRDVTYFPLTWHYAVSEFGWEYSFDAVKGLNVISRT